LIFKHFTRFKKERRMH